MGVVSPLRLRRKSLSCVRTRQSVETIEAAVGRTISGDTSDNQTSQTSSTRQRVANDNERSMGKTNKRQ